MYESNEPKWKIKLKKYSQKRKGNYIFRKKRSILTVMDSVGAWGNRQIIIPQKQWPRSEIYYGNHKTISITKIIIILHR